MTDLGYGAAPSGSQPGTPDAGWTAPQGAPAGPPAKKGLKKVLPIVGAVATAGIVGAGVLFGSGGTEVGDCVRSVGETDFEVVDCGSDDAESRVVGIEKAEVTYDEFMADDTLCASFEKTEYLLWEGELETEPGTVYCTEPV